VKRRDVLDCPTSQQLKVRTMNSRSSYRRFKYSSDNAERSPRSITNVCAPAPGNYFERFVCFVLAFTLLVCAESVNGQNEEKVVATINGMPIKLSEVDAASTNKLFSLQQQIFALRKAALENQISRRLLESEAARRKVSIEELKILLLAGPVDVSGDQVEELYTENILVFASMSADEARAKIRLDLEAQARLRRYREELAKLKTAANVEVLLDEPRLPIPRTADFASRGPARAEIVITEFSDFQCAYCRAVQSTLKQLLREYGERIRLDFKHLPLEQHSLATISAQAAFCGGKQGRFWEYHDALFSTPDLSKKFLDVAAAKSNLKLPLFQECLASSESRLAIIADLQEAKRLGIDSTPTFLINGKLLRGAVNIDQFKLIIDRELKSLQTGSGGQQK
jgi:protein-disulfide isomerase